MGCERIRSSSWSVLEVTPVLELKSSIFLKGPTRKSRWDIISKALMLWFFPVKPINLLLEKLNLLLVVQNQLVLVFNYLLIVLYSFVELVFGALTFLLNFVDLSLPLADLIFKCLYPFKTALWLNLFELLLYIHKFLVKSIIHLEVSLSLKR